MCAYMRAIMIHVFPKRLNGRHQLEWKRNIHTYKHTKTASAVAAHLRSTHTDVYVCLYACIYVCFPSIPIGKRSSNII